eukprot:NODE_544_length_2098_cov_73.644850_g504_i0.p1 GENE.NODE_544_length_2098_cov_73.644850_g504_i0~~NODE_544_length_2098_cov_73.644850_g504_i0.p1  ORF type:complete len:625 (+),score=213.59 NODE_544_length_2098_cov_73.644850_g504_i0:88-1962(+)
MGCGASSESTQTAAANAPLASPSAVPKPAAAVKETSESKTPATSLPPHLEAELKKFEARFAMITVDKEEEVYLGLLPTSSGLEIGIANSASELFSAVFGEAELEAAKGEKTWTVFFAAFKKQMVKASAKTDGKALALTIPCGDKTKDTFTFALPSKGKNMETLHRLFLLPLSDLFAKAKAGDDSKYTNLELEGNTKKAQVTENEQKLVTINNEIEPLSKNAKGALEDARAAKEQCDGVKKRIQRLKDATDPKWDPLYADGVSPFRLHTPHCREVHIPAIIPCDTMAMFSIRQKFGGDTSNVPTALNSTHEDIAALLSKIDEWEFDVFALHKCTNGGSLFMTAYYLLYKYGLVKQFEINETILVNFLQAVESSYHANPFHNSMHAADVLQVMHYIMDQGALKDTINMSPNDLLAALLSAACHDFDHPGLNNNFHIRTQSYLAVLYNDRSVLENHHLTQLFDLVKNPKFNIFHSLAYDQLKDIRETMIELLFATDMGLHFKLFNQFRRRLTEDKPWQVREDQRLAMGVALKMADISNCCRPAPIYKEWSKRMATEFYHQGDTERRIGLSLSPYMDKHKEGVEFPKSQTLFLSKIAVPLVEQMAKMCPKLGFALEQTRKNLQEIAQK